MEQLYCSVKDLVEDLGEPGKPESYVLGKIRAASEDLLKNLGQFLPSIDILTLQATSGHPTELLVGPLLKVTSIVNDGTTLAASDYVLRPDGRHWENGPYTSIEIARGGAIGAWSEKQAAIVITGWRGLYDEIISLGIAVSQLIGEATIAVSDGSLVSPGMMIKIDDEWELITTTGAASASTATLSGDLTTDSGNEEFNISDGTKIKIGELIKIDFELLRVLDISGNAIQTVRGVNGSKRSTHTSGAAINVHRTFAVTRGANGSTPVAHTAATVYQQIPPADINYLCRQVTALMIKKAQTGYSGRGGNDDLGTGFWINEFPKNQIDKIKANYFWGGS